MSAVALTLRRAPMAPAGGRVYGAPTMPRPREIPKAEVEFEDRPVDVRAAVRRPGPGRRAGHRNRHARRLVDGLRELARRPGARRVAASRSTRAPTARSPRAARARPDPGRLARRQPVRVLAALQVVPRARLLRGEDRGPEGLGSVRPLLAAGAGRCSPTPMPRARLRARRRRGVRRAAGAPERRGDPRVHLHHDDVHDARGDLPAPCASSTTTATTRSSRSPRRRTTRPRTSADRSASTRRTTKRTPRRTTARQRVSRVTGVRDLDHRASTGSSGPRRLLLDGRSPRLRPTPCSRCWPTTPGGPSGFPTSGRSR